MEKISTEQIAFVIVMAVLLMFVLPIVQSRTGKSLSELLFGVGRKKKQDVHDGHPAAEQKERDDHNGAGEEGA